MVEIVIEKIEKWYQSRRLWGAGLTLVATIILLVTPENYDLVSSFMMLAASALGITSWVAPKK